MKRQEGVYDFHTHSSLSDGDLSPLELIRRALVNNYKAIAITDHMGPGDLATLIPRLIEACALARAHWDILAIPGVELTHLPPAAIAKAAHRAKELGAWIVIVHGETISEPVESGTNLAAIKCPNVDILAHPGLLSAEEASLASANEIFLELSARQGHCLTNGHIARLARNSGAKLLLSSDAHQPQNLLTPTLAGQIAQGAGLTPPDILQLWENARLALRRLPN